MNAAQSLGRMALPILVLFILALPTPVLAETDLEHSTQKATLFAIYLALGLITALVLFILCNQKRIAKKKQNKLRIALFSSIVIIVVAVTVWTASATIYLNAVSFTKGPVHWHADFEVWNCGQELDLKDPTGLVNRIGTSTFHEHGDNRIHMEGVVIKPGDVSLKRFLAVVGGKLEGSSLEFPANSGMVTLTDGQLCSNGAAGKLQIFAYNLKNPGERHKWVYEQRKVDENYVIAPYSQVPPGDCFIIEFGEEKEKTDKLCETYRIAVEKGELRGS